MELASRSAARRLQLYEFALAFGVMFTTEGIPLIYYGDEIGLAGGGDPDNRRMMVWDDSSLSAAQLSLRERIRRLGRNS